ncbi:hypothetical protein DL96DRAFT_909959 [Flagelloscypha sp. PMI_526]|nr:hypothetical protein DL96DRAFT_909959 [Flagelloscypha sp. PMI_526]
MSGFEIFGAIGSVVAVIEAIMAANSWIQDFKYAKKEQVVLKKQISTFKLQLKTLEIDVIQSSDSAMSEMLKDIESGLQDIEDIIDGSGRTSWKFAKDKIKNIWVKLDVLKSFMTLSLVGNMSQSFRDFSDASRKDAEERYNSISRQFERLLGEQQVLIRELSAQVSALHTATAPILGEIGGLSTQISTLQIATDPLLSAAKEPQECTGLALPRVFIGE